jgi:hypothetical protein
MPSERRILTAFLLELLSLLPWQPWRVRSLKAAARRVYSKRRWVPRFRSSCADGAFKGLFELCTAESDASIELRLKEMNIPPATGVNATEEQCLWACISGELFELRPPVSSTFAEDIIKRCLTQPTDLVFALLHCDSIALLARAHPCTLNPSLFEIAIAEADDSRTIYALEAAHWLPQWAAISRVAFNAMLSGSGPKRMGAMHLVNQRSTVKEALDFAQENDVHLPLSCQNASKLHEITRVILRSKCDICAGGSAYIIKGDGSPATRIEQKEISNRINNLLLDDLPPD